MARKRKPRTASRNKGSRTPARSETQRPQAISEIEPPEKALPVPPMPEPGDLARRAIDLLTVPRVVVGTLPVLLVLVLAFFTLHSEQLARSRGDRLVAAHNWEGAAALYEDATDAYTDVPSFQIALARCYLETGRPGLALERVAAGREALRTIRKKYRAPLEADLTALGGWAQFASGEPKQGLETLRKAYEADPSHVLTNYALGAFYVGQRDVVSAGPFMRPLMALPEYADFADRYKRLLNDFIGTDLSEPETE